MREHSNQPIKLILLTASIIYLALCVLAALEMWKMLHTIIVHFFILFAIILITRQVLLFTFLLIKKRQKNKNSNIIYQPLVTILMPAYNEENVIEEALKSILSINYNNFEIIVIDDGSTDNTSSKVSNFISINKNQQKNIRLISQSNAGKANALNTGLIHANGNFILSVDSDAKLNKNCLIYGIQHFQDNRVGAVAGNVIVANDNRLITKFQQLEYLVSQNFVRQGLSLFGLVPIVPGPIGLFRKTAMLEARGYREDKDLFAEDADLSVRLLKLDWKITSDERMTAETEAPDHLFSLLRQRYRWKRGLFQTLHDNFLTLILSPGFKRPFIAIFLILETFLFEVIGFGITLFMIVNIIYTLSFNLLPLWLFILFSLDLLALIVSTPFREIYKWTPILLLQKISYSYALQAWGILALFDEWRAINMSWDKLERKGISNQGSIT